MSLTETRPPCSLARFRAALGKAALNSAFGAAVAVGVLGAGQAQALVVTVNGQQWDVTTITGDASFVSPGNAPNNDTTRILVVQPWWTGSGANGGLAQAFATAVGSGLGIPGGNNGAGYGPFFAYSGGPCIDVRRWPTPNLVGCATAGVSYTWAQARLIQPVPGPLPLFGAAAAFGFSRKLRKRISATKTVGASFTAG
jgi:hypothetical protein